MYSRSFFDLDGHGGQVMWIDPAAEQAPETSAASMQAPTPRPEPRQRLDQSQPVAGGPAPTPIPMNRSDTNLGTAARIDELDEKELP